MSKLYFASVISEIEQSDVFMTVKARICEAPEANLNGARVTEAFIDEIVSNETRYVGLPLYADKKALLGGNYTRLGHLYDTKTGEFHSTQIGSFYKFEKQKTEIASLDGVKEKCALIGYARIPKRNKKLSKAISELFAEGNLKFSFELAVGEYEELDDNTILIDASENNYLEGTAIVTYPACEEAVALELVAQRADDLRKGESEMAEVENKAEVVETEAVQLNAEEENIEASEEPEVEEAACKEKKNSEAEEETACTDKKEKAEEETAAVVMHENRVERTSQCAYDTETGKEICQSVTIETQTSDVVEGTLVETVDGVHVAEKESEENTPPVIDVLTPAAVEQTSTQNATPTDQNATPANTEPDNTGVTGERTAEQMIAELLEIVNSLKSEVAELKEQKAQPVVGEVNPFMDTLKTANKYSLLEKDEKMSNYSLLSK